MRCHVGERLAKSSVWLSIWSAALLVFVCHAGAEELPSIEPAELATQIEARLSRVEEFVELRQMAEARGLRVWLFGGTAAGFAHYVKWNMQLERGSVLQPDRFDYDFTNIYRSTQDVDIVIDGTPAQVEEFEQTLKTRFPYFMGSKSKSGDQWEVRSLRYRVGEKETLLHNPDFLHQHTDSNSTGMIELTRAGDHSVRDLRDWRAAEPQFLQDVAEGRLHYYFSEKHETTSRFKGGKNPPIFSAIRYLTKAFQFELKMRVEDLEKVRRVVAAFDPAAPRSSYVTAWLEKNGPKLMRHAIDVGYAWNVLESLGLRSKLIAISHPDQKESLGWWLSKEPLRDITDPRVLRANVTVAGASAKEIGLELVTHETSDYLAYEAIRRSHKGVPSVFISRKDGVGEAAVHGDGFYTRVGEKGARGTGFHIRMKVRPDATEGRDFLRVAADVILWLTRDKLEIQHESLRFDPVAAIEFVLDSRNAGEEGIRHSFLRKLERAKVNPDDQKRIDESFDRFFAEANGDIKVLTERLRALRALGFSVASPRLLRFLEVLIEKHLPRITELTRAGHRYTELYQLEEPILELLSTRGVIRSSQWSELMWRLIHAGFRADRLVSGPLNAAVALEPAGWNELFEHFFALGSVNGSLVISIIENPHVSHSAKLAAQWPKWVDRMLQNLERNVHRTSATDRRADDVFYAARGLLGALVTPQGLSHPKWEDWVARLNMVGRGLGAHYGYNFSMEFRREIIIGELDRVLHSPHWGEWMLAWPYLNGANFMGKSAVIKHPQWAEVMRAVVSTEPSGGLMESILAKPEAMAHPEWVTILERAIEVNPVGSTYPYSSDMTWEGMFKLLAGPAWNHPDRDRVIWAMLRAGGRGADVYKWLLRKLPPETPGYEEMLELAKKDPRCEQLLLGTP